MSASAANRRLAVYGSLAPGEANHGQLSGLRGSWSQGRIRGHLEDRGWGARIGFPALRLDATGREVAVQVFTSDDLPAAWPRLDAFEGADYRRVVAAVTLDDGSFVAANVYVLAD